MPTSIINRIDNFDKKWTCIINDQKFHTVIMVSFKIFSHVGSFVFWLGLAGLLYILDIYELSFWIYASCLNGGLITLPIKLLIKRDRPFISKNIGCKIIKKDIFILNKHTSFPSGHSVYYCSCSLILLMTLGYWWIYVLIIPFAFLVGYTRINLGAHFPFDVIIGFILGILIAILTWFLFPIYLPHFWHISDIIKYYWHIFFP